MNISRIKAFALGALALAAVWIAPAPALAGSGCSYIVTGAVLTAAQWNSCFQAKQNELGYTPINKAGDSMTGLLTTIAPTTTTAGFRLNPGVAPTVPTNGDIWTTSSGLYVQVNGSTIGPITGGAAGSFAGTSPITVSFPSGVVTYAFDFSVANVFTARQTINLNGTTTPTPITGAGLVVNPANSTVGRVQANAYGAIVSFTGVIYAGTAAAPTQVLSGTQLTGINAYAYTGSAVVGPIVSFRTYAAENISATAWGTKACIATTPSTTAVLTDSLCQQNSGGVTIGSPTGGDKGAGTLNSAGTIYINGSALSASAANLTVGTSTITGGTTTNILRNSAGVLAEYTITGTGTVVAMQTSPSFVTPALGVATGTSVAIGGCTIGTSVLCTTGNVVVGSGSFGLSGNISTTAWTTSGVRYKNVAAILTDTSSSGTVATAYTDLWGGNTIAASSSTTFTNYFTAYFTAATAGTNVTLTNAWALGADSAKIGSSVPVTISTTGLIRIGTALAAGLSLTGSDLLLVGNSNNTVRVTNNALNLEDQTSTFKINLTTILSSPSAAVWQYGAADAAVAVAQTTRVQSVVAGTAAANGANWTFIGSLPTGTGTSGDIIFQTGVKTGSGTTQGTPTTAVTIKGETQAVTTSGNLTVNGILNGAAGVVLGPGVLAVNPNSPFATGVFNLGALGWTASGTANSSIVLDTAFSRISAGVIGVGTGAQGSVAGTISVATIINAGITTDATHTTSTVCQDTTTHQYYFGSAALGVCLGTSGRQFKTAFAPMTAGIADLVKIKFQNYRFRTGYGDGGARLQYGPTAQDVEAVLPELAGHSANGETINYDSGSLLFIGLRAIQQLKAENDNIRAANDNLRAEVDALKAAR